MDLVLLEQQLTDFLELKLRAEEVALDILNFAQSQWDDSQEY